MVDFNSIEEYQELLSKIPGILNVRIIADADNNTLTEIHVLSNTSRSPKQIVRDIQSALLASYNIRIDHKIISIAKVMDGDYNVNNCRLSIDSIQLFTRNGMVEARVLLKMDDRIYEGQSAGGNTVQGRLRVAAEAALQAVHQYLDEEFVFILSDVTKFTLADRKVAAVSVMHFTNMGNEYLSGSAFVQNSDDEAAVKATLDAVNRRLFMHSKK